MTSLGPIPRLVQQGEPGNGATQWLYTNNVASYRLCILGWYNSVHYWIWLGQWNEDTVALTKVRRFSGLQLRRLLSLEDCFEECFEERFETFLHSVFISPWKRVSMKSREKAPRTTSNHPTQRNWFTDGNCAIRALMPRGEEEREVGEREKKRGGGGGRERW